MQSIWRGLNVNCADSSGYTPLHHASLNGHRDVVLKLLQYDASTNLADSKGCFPLHLAAWKGDAEIVRILIHHGPSHCRVNEQAWAARPTTDASYHKLGAAPSTDWMIYVTDRAGDLRDWAQAHCGTRGRMRVTDAEKEHAEQSACSSLRCPSSFAAVVRWPFERGTLRGSLCDVLTGPLEAAGKPETGRASPVPPRSFCFALSSRPARTLKGAVARDQLLCESA
ncbi:hypothetical protein AAFF_G00168150 [Aldrovandia affinis]|uniref:Uncharacterized protein n=1 Tax=Aldrovandia affinis TaxID=143900 RepID=A0AAD7W8E9_9TELE|nr:hypothetical protein AAFF_G00168150 [Aldrovandia affinis]